MGVVSEYVRKLIARQVDDNGVVVCYDPDGAYSEAAHGLGLDDAAVLFYESSLVCLRQERTLERRFQP